MRGKFVFYFTVCTLVFQQMISIAFCEVLFEQDFSAAISDDPAYAQILTGSLDFKFHQETGDRLWIENYDAGVSYPLSSAMTDLSVHQTLYISLSLRSLSTTNWEKFAGLVLYHNGQEVFGLGNDYWSGNFSFWPSDGSGVAIGDVPTAVDTDVHKIVMRIDYNPTGPETIKVGIDPFCRRSEARQPDHIWTTYSYELSFDEIRLRCGNAYCTWEFDEIRIGTDWASVTASDNEPGEHVAALTANAAAPGQEEMILADVARFWPNGVTQQDALPSLALETPHASIGSVAPAWQFKPQFGTASGNKYAYFEIPSDVDLYGTGEVTGSLMRNGYKIVLFNKDNYGYNKPDQLYQSHPWVLGIRPDGTSFGIIFDTIWRAELNLRSGILFTIPDYAPSFPVIVIEGANPQSVMIKLGELTGRMPLPPRWALGYQQCRYSYGTDAHVRYIADTFRSKQIPCDVIWMDIDYMYGYRIFTFDTSRFPDPLATNTYLHDNGFKGVWMIDPGVYQSPGFEVYDSGSLINAWVQNASGGTFAGPVWPGDCVFPDFTIPAVRSWWAGLYLNFMANGIDGVWNDMNEPAVFNDATGWTMPWDNLHRGGGDLPAGSHEQYHNVYGMLMARASREGIQTANPDKRPFVLSRANYLGGHRYAATWSGDNIASWEHLKWSIPMTLNLSLSGQPFNGPDIGGFSGVASADLWAHWISVGAFYPFSRAHTNGSDGAPDQEPWSFGTTTENAARIALQRRYRLMPYLYTIFRESSENGLPVMRPILFADPADMDLRMEDQAFLLGQDVMVIPKWAQNTQLPQGTWRSISLVGEDAQTDPYQCDVKVRGGAIVPMGPIVQSTDDIPTQQQLTLVVVLDDQGQATGTLYEDAGDGFDYLQGTYCVTTFNAQKSGDSVVVTCTQQGNLSASQRQVSVTVVEDSQVYTGSGDICSGVTVTGLPYSGDLTSDGKVDQEDMAELGSGWDSEYDLNTLLKVAEDWLSGTSL